MYNLLVFCILACLVTSSISLESNFYGEETCASKGGACVLENECPHVVNTKYKSLCKNQQPKGAVCCKNFPLEELNCLQSHNVCRKPGECPESLTIGRKGCEGGNICCVLI